MRVKALEVIENIEKLQEDLLLLKEDVSREISQVRDVSFSIDIDEVIDDIVKRVPIIKGINGQDGRTPTRDELIELIKPLIPAPKDGRDGKDAEVNQAEIIEEILKRIDIEQAVERLINQHLDGFTIDASKVRGIKSLLPKNPPIYGGGSGATFLKSMRDVYRTALESPTDGDILTWDSNLGKFTLGQGTTVLRITTDTTLDTSYRVIFCDTDENPIVVTLPAGVDGIQYRIINSGSSGKNVTITPDGTELLLGANSSFTLTSGDVLIITYESTEGWW